MDIVLQPPINHHNIPQTTLYDNFVSCSSPSVFKDNGRIQIIIQSLYKRYDFFKRWIFLVLKVKSEKPFPFLLALCECLPTNPRIATRVTVLTFIPIYS